MPSLGDMTIYSIARMKLSPTFCYVLESRLANIKLPSTFLRKAGFSITILNDV